MLPTISAVGNLAADPQLGYANNGTPVLNFTLYCNGVANGNDKHVERIKCAVWGKAAESLSPILKKGMPVMVTGQCITEPYKTNAGEVAANFKINRAEVGLINTGNRRSGCSRQQRGPRGHRQRRCAHPGRDERAHRRPQRQRPAAGHEPAPVLVVNAALLHQGSL